MPTLLPPKKDVAMALLERASVFIHLDPRDPSVQVPSWFKRQPQLVLQVGLNMVLRIPDLEIGDDAIACTLSFNRSPHYCFVPWKAVYALVGEDGRGMVWPEDIPPEVSAQAQGLPAKPRLRSVPASPSPSPQASPSQVPPSRAPEKASNSQQPGAQQPNSQRPGSPRARFRAVAERDSVDVPSSRGQAQGSSASVRASTGDLGGRRETVEGPPVLSLSGSRRRQANAPSSRRGGGAAESRPPSDELSPGSTEAEAREPVQSQRPSESSDSQRAQSSDSQERSARSSERPYLRLVR